MDMAAVKRDLACLASRFMLALPGVPQDVGAPFLIFGVLAEGRTMLTRRRLSSLYFHCTDPGLPPGSFVECGVARGGALALMAFAADRKRPVWGFDSFEGMPALTEEDRNEGQKSVGYRCSGPQGMAEAQRTLRRFSVSSDRVTLVRGWFEDTLPGRVSELAPIAVLRLDNDWYKSTRYCLETLYDTVVRGGLVIVDDYHTFAGCRAAVDEFRGRRGITSPLVTTEESSEAYWRKTEDPRPAGVPAATP